MNNEHESELSTKLKNGPYGIGDPNDKHLRKVEMEVLIPKIMRDRARVEKCIDEVKAFETCCKASSVFMVFKCRKENTNLKSCLTDWYQNEEFKNECKDMYLKDRTEYRSTGLSKKRREHLAVN